MSMTKLEERIAADLIGEEVAGCEVRWNGGETCGKPVSWHIMGHSHIEHVYQPSTICDDCKQKAEAMGFGDPVYVCIACGEGPMMKDIRPI